MDLTLEDVRNYQRSANGLLYEKRRAAMAELAKENKHPVVRAANAELARMKSVSPGTVHNVATLTSMSVQYANDEYIGDRLMPVESVGKLSDKYFIYSKRDRLAVPDTKLGPQGKANQISETRSTATYSCDGLGLSDYLDALTLANQDAPLNEMIDLSASVDECMALDREIRQADVLCTAGNYSGNTVAIAAANRWDTASGGTIIKNIQDALAACWQGRGPGKRYAFCSLPVWNVISRNPAILDLFKYGGTAPGLATPDMIAKFFMLDGLLIGAARKDTANKGQTASYSRIWSDVFGIVRVAPGLRNAGFGKTFVMGGARRADVWYDVSLGTRGGYWARVSCEEDLKVVAGDTSYLITTPIG